ncbi:MAG: cytochrome c [Planctomycetota bacterium]
MHARTTTWTWTLGAVLLMLCACQSSDEKAPTAPDDISMETPLAEPDPEMAAQGEDLFGKLNCKACHQTTGGEEAARGPEEGPNLGGIGMRRAASWLRSHILNPRPHTVDSPMPGFTVTDDQLDALVAYLQSLQ